MVSSGFPPSKGKSPPFDVFPSFNPPTVGLSLFIATKEEIMRPMVFLLDSVNCRQNPSFIEPSASSSSRRAKHLGRIPRT